MTTYLYDCVQIMWFIRSFIFYVEPRMYKHKPTHAEDILTIDEWTSKEELSHLFECSRGLRPIGFYNEYYQTCELKKRYHEIVIQNQCIQGHDLLLQDDEDQHHPGHHVELRFLTNVSNPRNNIRLVNATIWSSGIYFETHHVTIDASSSVNATARGLQYGPGYNSWSASGSSFAGMGGMSLNPTRSTCDAHPRRRSDVLREIGSILVWKSMDLHNFRLYGSGGGQNQVRGGGRIHILGHVDVWMNGSILANGGDNDVWTEGAGSGGTVIVNTSLLHGSGQIQANGGASTPLLSTDPFNYEYGGGGGGGGGRIRIEVQENELSPDQIQALGGGNTSENSQECQRGGEGTMLYLNSSSNGNHTATLVIRGQNESSSLRNRSESYFTTTPIHWDDNDDDTTDDICLVRLNVSGFTAIATAQVSLACPGVENELFLGPGAQIQTVLDRSTIELSATRMIIQGTIGPVEQQRKGDESLLRKKKKKNALNDTLDWVLPNVTLNALTINLEQGEIYVSNLLMSAQREIVIDSESVIRYSGSSVKMKSVETITAQGLIIYSYERPQPLDYHHDNDDEYAPYVALECLRYIHLALEPIPDDHPTTQKRLRVSIHAGIHAQVSVPPESSPFAKLVVTSGNTIAFNGGDVVGVPDKCEALDTLRNACERRRRRRHTSSIRGLFPLFSRYDLVLEANVQVNVSDTSFESLMICSPTVVLQGRVSATGRGCGANFGPGKSTMVSSLSSGERASGGAGHGGLGGEAMMMQDVGALVLSSSAGHVYDNASWPRWPGSGAAGSPVDDHDNPHPIIGGAGGGLIYIQTSHLIFQNATELSVKGLDGLNRGGGGSGGTIVLLNLISLVGTNAVIDVSGGCACSSSCGQQCAAPACSVCDITSTPPNFLTGGGGGGGGRLHLAFLNTSSDAQDSFFEPEFRNEVRLGGGISSKGLNPGAPGEVSPQACGPGRGGLACQSCPRGTASGPGKPQCLTCSKGTFAPAQGSVKCLECPSGSFNPMSGALACQVCIPGTYAPTPGQMQCLPCAPGFYALGFGSVGCTACPKGSITTVYGSSRVCSRCALGNTTVSRGSSVCIACPAGQKPAFATYDVPGNCSYVCAPGRVGLECLTPFEKLVQPIGGPLGFVLLCFGFLLTVFSTWGIVTYRREEHLVAEEMHRMMKQQQSVQPLDPASGLTFRDIRTNHLGRIYFSGHLSITSPWKLSPVPMPSLANFIHPVAFAAFAHECETIVGYSENETLGLRVLSWLCPALVPVVLSWLRTTKLHQLQVFATSSSATTNFFKVGNPNRGILRLEVGATSDGMTGYIDLLWYIQSGLEVELSDIPGLRRQPGKLDLPLVFLAAGSGRVFTEPLFLDTKDTWIQSAPRQLRVLVDQEWIDFIATLNQLLRLLSFADDNRVGIERAQNLMRDICQHVVSFQQLEGYVVHFGLYQGGSGQDLKDLCPLYCPDVVNAAEGTQSTSHTLHSVLQGLMGGSTDKLALWIDQKPYEKVIDQPTTSTREKLQKDLVFYDHPTEPRVFKVQKEQSEYSPEFELATSRIRQEALCHEDNDHDHLLVHHHEENPRAQEQQALLHVSSSFSKWRQTFSILVRKSKRHCFQLHNISIIPHEEDVLLRDPRSRRRQPHPFASGLLLLALLCSEMLLCLVFMTEVFCIQMSSEDQDHDTDTDTTCSHTLWTLSMLVYPGALVISPLIGLAFVLSRFSRVGRQYLVWNTCSRVNYILALAGLGWYAQFIRWNPFVYWCVLMSLKTIQERQGLWCLAQYEAERTSRGWTGLFTTSKV